MGLSQRAPLSPGRLGALRPFRWGSFSYSRHFLSVFLGMGVAVPSVSKSLSPPSIPLPIHSVHLYLFRFQVTGRSQGSHLHRTHSPETESKG